MKVFEAHSLIEAANNRKKQYETLEDQLQTLKKAFLGVADLGEDFQGKGADNIKDFYKGQAEIVDSWLKLVEAQIAFFKGVSGDIKDKKLADSYVEVSFLDHELKNADLKATEIVSGLKLEMDKIIASISDIVDLDNWTLDDYIDKMSKAQTTRQNTIDAVNQLEESLKTEYTNLQALDSAVLGKYSGLMEATSHGKTASPMYFSLKSFHSSEIYKNTIEVENQAANYIEFKNEQAEARRLQEKQEEEANKPWYLKALDAAGTFVGEVSGYYDYKRAAEGVDPVTGEKLTDGQRVAAGAMAAAGFIPIVGWAGRAFKGGKAIYKTGKGLITAEHALDAYKASKTLNVLKMTEMGAYGLVASNGFSEAVTGKDMFGNKVSEERRKQGLIEATLSLVGAGAVAKTANHGAQTLAKTAGKNIPLAKSPKVELVQKGNNILEKVKSFQVPTNVRVYVEQPASATGHHIGTPIVRVNVEKTPVKELGIVKMVSGGGTGTGRATRLIPGTPGKPTTGDPTKLGKNILESMGLPRSASWKGYQAQHIIPSQLNKHPVIKKIGMEMNDASNGIFLPIPMDDISGLSRHRGYHSVYNNVVRRQLDKLDVNQDITILEKQVYELQQKLKKGVEIGIPLYKTKVKNLEEFYKSGKNKKLPIWNRGGGATEELWERWLSK
ncbi:T7SS effector LXG polymorphic toxin [Bacillus paralicheniformis]|uniref:T7SS effector LXG polymorphic toxin n=1 Tax=Bacillus paralicheniformis TaxID=1648923 RepID=UPI00363314AE